MKIIRSWLVCAVLLTTVYTVQAQAVCGLSAGVGVSYLSHGFTLNGSSTPLQYSSPSLNLAGELSWGPWYIEMSLAALLSPFSVRLGEDRLSLAGYEANSGVDFTAIGIGYLAPISGSIDAGASLGFHVSGFFLSPPAGNLELLAIEGYYGTIGLSLTPRLRYRISERLRCSLSLPLGLDFAPMSDEVIHTEGSSSGSNPAIIRPAGLDPEFTGLSVGINITLGYFFGLSR